MARGRISLDDAIQAPQLHRASVPPNLRGLSRRLIVRTGELRGRQNVTATVGKEQAITFHGGQWARALGAGLSDTRHS